MSRVTAMRSQPHRQAWAPETHIGSAMRMRRFVQLGRVPGTDVVALKMEARMSYREKSVTTELSPETSRRLPLSAKLAVPPCHQRSEPCVSIDPGVRPENGAINLRVFGNVGVSPDHAVRSYARAALDHRAGINETRCFDDGTLLDAGIRRHDSGSGRVMKRGATTGLLIRCAPACICRVRSIPSHGKCATNALLSRLKEVSPRSNRRIPGMRSASRSIT